ncbi:serine hydrolase domain-containing protein [Brevundimonas goettingensis]|uniref:Beta-lactamase family protein n=1 Tax=Brevundimonas goettingensis TaxID=2774190 RepID=A0A975C0Y9_9CAUL|nr:serine hydrolase domain-containing protein [Brevundimonas goettingensis]QTC91863.1 beta-lactamase family protein [Brevundimonas goettingensis]
MTQFTRRHALLTAVGASALITAPAFARSVLRPDPTEDTRVDAIAQEFGFNGVILLGRAGRPEFRKAYGVADVATGRPASVGDRYAIASISKWLTVTAILQLVDQGRLALDAPINTWLPDYRTDTGGTVTLRHLLNNTSGIPNLLNAAVGADPTLNTSTMPAAEAVKRFCSGDPIFAPGARFDYVPTNWILVMAIMEAATGEAYPALMDRLVITPLGLPDTGLCDAAFLEAGDVAKAYKTLSPPVLKMWPRPTFIAAAGGFYSTAADLLRAAHGVFDGDLLSASSREEMARITVPDQHYSLGGRVAVVNIDGQVRRGGWETGRTDGYRSVLGHLFDDHRTVVVLNNTDMSQQVMDQIALRLLNATWAEA